MLSDASGSTGSFAVPTQFRGARPATTEARYPDGGNAGPAECNPYQQWDTAFSAYTGDAIRLTPEFFNAVGDGSRIILTLHFWSGATVTYYVAKTGTSVTGTTG